jgi:Geranylgeranyl pyrophosphate synthase
VDHLLGSGGKRLRPALVFLSARLCGADPDVALFAAAGVEMLHTATLVHDDLIDGSLMRRGAETLNARWSPAATVLTGDYLFARAAYWVARTENTRLVQRFAETLMVICNGEIRQMFDGRGKVPSFQEYEQRIYAKTASLIALSAESGAILAHADEEAITALRVYGERLGLAFQSWMTSWISSPTSGPWASRWAATFVRTGHVARHALPGAKRRPPGPSSYPPPGLIRPDGAGSGPGHRGLPGH